MEFDVLDEYLQFFEDHEEELPSLLGWTITAQELIDVNVQNKFEKYGVFLLYISDQMEKDTIKYSKEETAKRSATKQYINQVFSKYLK